MTQLTDLPIEILWKLQLECPRELRSLNRQFYRMHNDLYKERMLRWLPPTENERGQFWKSLKKPIAKYVESLDFLRKPARLIVECLADDSVGFCEFIEDSWYVVYNALNGPLKCWNHSMLLQDRDSLDYHKPIFTGNFTLPYSYFHSKKNHRVFINAWFYIDNLYAASKLPGLVTEVRNSQYANYEARSTSANISDFIKETGIYCFNLGEFSRNNCETEVEISPSGNKLPYLPFEIRLVERSMAPPTYFENSDLIFLGYDFNSYDKKKPWLFFHIEKKFKSTICNPYEQHLSESLVRLTNAFPFTHSKDEEFFKKIENLKDIKPYFDEDCKAIRKFAYKYPKDHQDLQREETLPDWRAPHLRF